MNVKRVAASKGLKAIGLWWTAVLVASAAVPIVLTAQAAWAQATGTGAADAPTDSGIAFDTDKGNPGTTQYLFYLRNPNAKNYGPQQYGGQDIIQDKKSMGPGTVVLGPANSGPVYIWPKEILTSTSSVPTFRDQAITKNMLKTFGLPISDTQFQAIQRYDDDIFVEQMTDPQHWEWLVNAMAGLGSTNMANSTGTMANNQAQSAIGFTKAYLTNFTAEAGNQWQTIRDQLFIPMAILLLLPGAVLAQARAVVAQGSPILGEVSPFEGIIRSIIAIVLIPGSFLVINYGIDVSNSITFTISDEYRRIFGSDMYNDAICGQMRAFAGNEPMQNLNAILPNGQAQQDQQAQQAQTTGNTVWNELEVSTMETRRKDPCANIDQQLVPDEQADFQKQMTRFMTNGANAMLTQSWNIMCAFQMAYLYYLWCMGPIAAALWVWPVGKMRNALPSWTEGVIVLCFWSLFWNTVVLLMACFRGVGDSGTVIFTALNTLATYCVQYAFDFGGLVSNGASQGVQQALQGMLHGAQSAASAKGGQQGPGGMGRSTGQRMSGRNPGGPGHGGAQPGGPGGSLVANLQHGTQANTHSGLFGGPGPSAAGLGATLQPGTGGHLSGGATPGSAAALTGNLSSGLQTGPGSPGGLVPPPPMGPVPGLGAVGGSAITGGAFAAAGLAAMGPLGALNAGPTAVGPLGALNAGPTGALTAGQMAEHSQGLGLRLGADGRLNMNAEAMAKMSAATGADPQQSLANAMFLANQGQNGALNDFMNKANASGVLDPQTNAALAAMQGGHVVPFMGQDGSLKVTPQDALALGQTGNMPLSGAPTAATTQDANANALNGLQNLSSQEGKGNFSLFDATTGQAITDPTKIPGNDLVQALGANGQPFAQFDPSTQQWSALTANGQALDVTLGANGQWLAGGNVPVSGDPGGNFAASGTTFAYNPATGTFDVNGTSLPASALSGALLTAAYTHVPAADATISAISQPGVAANLGAAINGDASAMAAVAQGLQSTGVSADALVMAARGNALAEARVMGQEAAVNPAYAHQVAQSLGVSDSVITNSAVNPLAAAQVTGAEAARNAGFGQALAAQMPGGAQEIISQAASNPVAAAQLVGMQAQSDSRYASYAAGALQLPSSELVQQMASNPVLGAQAVGAGAAADRAYADAVGQMKNVTAETVMAAANNPTIAAQMVGAEALANSSYASFVSQTVPQLNAGLITEAAHSPLAATQLAAAEAAAHPSYAAHIASPAMGVAPDQFGMVSQSPIAAAQALSSELATNPHYASYVAQSMHLQPEVLQQAAHNPIAAAQVAAAESMVHPGYGHIASAAMRMEGSPGVMTAAGSNTLAAAQMLATEAQAYPGGVQQLASHFNVTPELVQQASHNPVAAAQLVAAEAAINQGYMSAVSQTTNMSSDSIVQAVSNQVSASQLMAAEAIRDPGFLSQIAQALHVPQQTVVEAATRPDAAGVIANAAYQMNPMQFVSGGPAPSVAQPVVDSSLSTWTAAAPDPTAGIYDGITYSGTAAPMSGVAPPGTVASGAITPYTSYVPLPQEQHFVNGPGITVPAIIAYRPGMSPPAAPPAEPAAQAGEVVTDELGRTAQDVMRYTKGGPWQQQSLKKQRKLLREAGETAPFPLDQEEPKDT